ncbi:S1C family serine protease [Paenibacillus radicis (ex Xue et al. 2023)]|uniref:Trypsin-like peptidase domain-containing protein n=1 Tax=Paenibacillus radicis (ex Xue et al. 2023) TaxID=2972489 RepID=A0ABT1YLV8_9BACL|nr:trypsin-like peptidase domain-containing protein [Paenibacillus radicis (ex Xue et al. 2023)]MCR8633389.1 trypsin-like peptidase domain-containing protein [Paenibacillus radicis (ex Xue et al. 2023)]
MDDNKRGYDDFFRRSNGESNSSSNEQAGQSEANEPRQERPSHYYSYGPYKSDLGHNEPDSGMRSDGVEAAQVEMTPPRPMRPFSYNVTDKPMHDQMNGWQQNEHKKKGSSLRTGFTAFLAGALVVGSLMFASDKMNWFTGPQGVMSNKASAATGQTTTGSSGGGTVKPTAFDLGGRPENIAQIAEQSGPAVVKIETKVKAKASSRGGSSLLDDPFFRQFFGDNGGGSKQQPKSDSGQLQPGGMGTGFIFEKSGYILTNEHVIDGADEIWVTVEGYDKPFKATLLGNSYDLDLAALKIDGDKEFAALPLGKAEDTKVGDWVVAIGNPYGFDHTVTVGVLSARERPISIPDTQGTREYKHLLQTDASINPGNSGGPLLNLNGEVIGINTAVSAQAQGIGFAIPTSTISSVLDNLKNNVKIPKEPLPYIGVKLSDIDKDWLTELKLQNTEGAIVSEVERKSPGFIAGIRPYDVITEVNGAKVKKSQDLVDKIKALKVNDQANLTIMRDGKKESITVTIGDRNAEAK